jgi:alanyl-tRNA synthetase
VGGRSEDTTPAQALQQKFASQEEELKRLRRELDQVRMKQASSSVADAAGNAVDVKGWVPASWCWAWRAKMAKFR